MKNIFIAFLLFSAALFAQNVKFFGDAKPGGIVIGVGNNIAGAELDKTQLQIDKSGAFIFGFDRNAKGKYTLKISFKNKKTENFIYQIEQQEYEEQRLILAKKYVTPPSKESRRIKRENQLMKTARAKVGKVKDALFMAGFTDPVDSVDIRSTFGVQRILNGKPSNIHNGLDYGAEVGDSIYAISDGIVRIAGKNFFYNGNFVLLDHGQGLTSVYLHLSKIIAGDGATVKKGELIGLAGSTGRATGPHLHLGVQWYKKRIDPMSLFSLNLPVNE